MDKMTKNMDNLFAAAKNAKVDYPVESVGKMLGAAAGVGMVGAAAATGKGLAFKLSTISIMVGSITAIVATVMVLNTSANDEITPVQSLNTNSPVIEQEIEPKEVETFVQPIQTKIEQRPIVHELAVELQQDNASDPETVFMPELPEPEPEFTPVPEPTQVETITGPTGGDWFTAGNFHSVQLQISADVHITDAKGGKEEIRIDGDQSFKDYIDFIVEDGVLIIKQKDGIKRKESKQLCGANYGIDIKMNEVQNIDIMGSGSVHGVGALNSEELSISIRGSGDVIFDDVSPKELNIRVKGSGDVTVKGDGTIDSGEIAIAGSGDVCTGKNRIKKMDVSIAGSGDVCVLCEEVLNVSIAGSGDVTYAGNPQLSVATTGSGEVSHCDTKSCKQ